MLHIEFRTHGALVNADKRNSSVKNYILSILHDLGVSRNDLELGDKGTYIENIEPITAKRKFYTYQNFINYDGVSVFIGKFFIRQDGSTGDTFYDCETCVRLVYNPNKHQNSEFLQRLKKYFCNGSFTGHIVKYDLAIDINGIEPNFVNVFTKKLKSTSHDTQYYGKKARHGHLKVYNKSKEAKIKDDIITRVEYTLMTDKSFPSDEIHIPLPNSSMKTDYSSLTASCKNYVLMLNQIKELGGDWKIFYDNLIYRTRKKIEPFVIGTNEKLTFNNDLVCSLLTQYSAEFNITQRFDEVNEYGFEELDELDELLI